jgi:hypothetical protein
VRETAGRSDLDDTIEPAETVTIVVSLSGRRKFPSAAVLEIFSDSLYPIGEAFHYRRSFLGREFVVRWALPGPFESAIPVFAGASLLVLFYLCCCAEGKDSR